MKTFLRAGLALALAFPACSSTAPKTTSSLEGRIVQSSFRAAPTSVTAIDEAGARVTIPLGADGSFRADLAKGHTYRLEVASPGGGEPVVFPRRAARLDTTFRITNGGAKLLLGSLRHFDAAPNGGFPVSATARANCDGADDVEVNDDHDATKPMSIPDKSPPDDDSACGEDDGEEDDD